MGAVRRLVLRWRNAAATRVRTGRRASLERLRRGGRRLSRSPLVGLSALSAAVVLGTLLFALAFAGMPHDGEAVELAAGLLLLCTAAAVVVTEVAVAVRSRETRAVSREAVRVAEEIVRRHQEEAHDAVAAAETLLHQAWLAGHQAS